MMIEILFRLVIFCEIALGITGIGYFISDIFEANGIPTNGFIGLVMVAVVISFLYFVLHIPLKKQIGKVDRDV